MIVFSPDNTPMPQRAALEPALRAAFPDATLRMPDVTGVAPRIHVTPTADPPFSVGFLANGTITTDGTLEQDSTVATLIRSLLPDSQRAIAITPDGSQFVELVPGITVDAVANGWRDFDELNLD